MMNKQERSFDKQESKKGAKWVALVALALAAVLAFPLAANAMANSDAPGAAAAAVEPGEDNEPAENPAVEAAENAALALSAKLTPNDALKALIGAGILTADAAVGVTPSLESENGRIVYEASVGQAEYKVDANTGEVIADSEADVEYEG